MRGLMRSRARRATGIVAVALLGSLWLPYIPLRAADPLIRFQELMAGANGDSRVQFITFVVDGNRAKCWGPQVAPNTPGADQAAADGTIHLATLPNTGMRNVSLARLDAPAPDVVIESKTTWSLSCAGLIPTRASISSWGR
jgi:hypothetical protein